MTRLRFGFLIDPIETLIVGHDTTLAFMLECQRRGHEVHYFEQKDLTYRAGGVRAGAKRVELRRTRGDHFRVLEESALELAALDVVFLRKDPPVDVEYLHATQLVELARGPLFLNDPAALRDANEKLYVLRYPELIPRTLVSRDLAELRGFLRELDGEMVIKPVDGFAGRGVLHLRETDRNLNSLLELATGGGRVAIVAQQYLPASREGDKRIILLDGDPLGALLRIPQDNDVRGNLAAGGRSAKSTLTDREREICGTLAPDLRRRGLYFVGLDVIGGYLTEVNVTSPTGVEEINTLDEIVVESHVIDFVERARGEGRAARRA
ncbi:MAG TPA: glutathione synthase [Stellaceae bacterium]|nr:glutathione synthase [Stellaceae bacterium]